MDLVALIASIPATFWGVIIGSLFTVIGVAITNASNTQRLRLQHEHERARDERARDLTMRRDVYMGAFEAIAAGMTMVGNFGELEVPFQELMRAYMGKSSAIGKVTIVGRESTIQAVADFEQALTGAFIRLSGQRQAVEQHHRQGQALAQRIARSIAEQERLAAEIERGNDEATSAPLRRSLEHERRQTEALRREEAEIAERFMPGLMALIRATMEEVTALDGLLAAVIREVRSELGLEFDETFYRQLITASHEKRAADFEAFVGAGSGSGGVHEATPTTESVGG